MNDNQEQVKKRITPLKIIAILVFAVPIVFGAFFMFEMSLKQVSIVTSESPNGENTLEFFEVGEPVNDSPSTIKIKSSEGNMEAGLAINGEIPTEDNFDVVWETEQAATITFTGEAQDPTIIEFDTEASEVFNMKEDGLKLENDLD